MSHRKLVCEIPVPLRAAASRRKGTLGYDGRAVLQGAATACGLAPRRAGR